MSWSLASMRQEGHPLRLLMAVAPQERLFKDHLRRHLAVLGNLAPIDIWTHERVPAGADWTRAFEAAISRADIALLLLSVNLLESPTLRFISAASERRTDQPPLHIIPVLVRTCQWQLLPWLERLQPLPSDGVPIARRTGDAREAAYSAIAYEILTLARPSGGRLRDDSAMSFTAVLQEATSGDDIRSFLQAHPELAARALSLKHNPTLIWSTRCGNFWIDLLVGEFLPTIGIRWRAFLFGDPRATGSNSARELVSAVASMRKLIATDAKFSRRTHIDAHAPDLQRMSQLLGVHPVIGIEDATLFLSRRNALSADLFAIINQVNSSYDNLLMRTYDAMVDGLAQR